MGFLSNWLEKRIDLSEVQNANVVADIEERLSTKALAFYIAQSYICDTLSKCEIKHYVKGKEVKDRMYYLLNISPNTNESASELKKKFFHKLFYDGEALMFVEKNQLYVADGFLIDYRPIKGNEYTNISLLNETRTFKRKASDVFYMQYGEVKKLVDSMLNDYSELLKYSFETYKSTNNEKYKLILDEVKMGDKDFNEKYAQAVKKQLESFINSQKSVYLQFKGYNLEQMKSSDGKTDSSDFRNIRKEIFEVTAQAFKMPVSMLYGNMTNVKDIVSSYITFAIDPLAKMTSEVLTKSTGTVEDYLNGTYFDVDTTSIIYHDIFEIAPNIEKLISSGVYNIDRVLEKIGEQPLNTEFSKQHWMTKNFDKIENLMNGISNQNNNNSFVKGGE